MALQSTVFMLLTIAFLMANTASTLRGFPTTTNPISDLKTRLEESNHTSNTTDCWTALSEFRSCSNEIIGFFLNGYTDIDAPCCHAIEVITRHCWPSMLSVLGISVEEGNLLAGYCDKTSAAPAAAPPVSADGRS